MLPFLGIFPPTILQAWFGHKLWSLRLLRAYPINTGQNLILKWNAEHPSLFVPHIISSLARLTQWLFSISVCPLFITSATCATAPWCKETDGGHHDSGQARLPSSKKAADFEMEPILQTQHFLAYPIYHSKPWVDVLGKIPICYHIAPRTNIIPTQPFPPKKDKAWSPLLYSVHADMQPPPRRWDMEEQRMSRWSKGDREE